MPVSAAVLAGGRGTRLGGVTKALIEIDGKPIVARTVAILARLASPVVINSSDEKLRVFGELVPDAARFAGRGPLAGLLAVLEASPHERCLVVASDMPFLEERLLARLVALAEESGAAAVVPRTDRWHPLVAVWSKRALPAIRARLEADELAVQRVLDDVGALAVAEADLRRYDPFLRSLENVNTPGDLDRARTLPGERS